MNHPIHCLCLLVVLLSSSAAMAGEPDPLEETQNSLTDRTQREALIKKSDAQTQWLHKQTENLAGTPENTDELYGLASEVMSDLVLETGGDTTKMMQLMELAKKDPKAFAEKLSPDKQKKLRELSKKLPPSGNFVAPPKK